MLAPIIIGSVVTGVIALIGVAIYSAQKYENARTEKFRELATEMGLEFEDQAAPHVQSEAGNLRLFNQGHSRKFQNMLHGTANGVEMAIFEYRYVVGHGKNRSVHQQSVIYFRSPGLASPNFELRPEHFFHKIGQAFGYMDIDFESHPDFSKNYLLRGEDETAIRSLFTPERLDYFESIKGISVEAQGDRLVFYRQGKRIKPEEVRALMADGFRVYKLFDTRVD